MSVGPANALGFGKAAGNDARARRIEQADAEKQQRREPVADLIVRLLATWDRTVSRLELEAGMVIYRNDALRVNILAGTSATGLRGQTVSGVGPALKLLEERGQVKVEKTEFLSQISLLSTPAPESHPAEAEKLAKSIEAADKILMRGN